MTADPDVTCRTLNEMVIHLSGIVSLELVRADRTWPFHVSSAHVVWNSPPHTPNPPDLPHLTGCGTWLVAP